MTPEQEKQLEELGKALVDLGKSDPAKAEELLREIAEEWAEIPNLFESSVKYKRMPDGTIGDIQIRFIVSGFEDDGDYEEWKWGPG